MTHQIGIIGLGYVGLPLARLFATRYPVVGFDINSRRIAEIKVGKDVTTEVDEALLQSVLVSENPVASRVSVVSSTPQFSNHLPTGLYCTDQLSDLADADIYIITVPTPVDRNHRPNLEFLYQASEMVGSVLKKGDVVIYESTVYPGVTEEECVPVLEKASGMQFNQDFFCGYSPERINPGDKERTLETIKKVTSGSTPEIGKLVDELYCSVITAGTHLASSIKVAEASKVIENAQRDINIAFVNELAKIFSLMDLDTHEVLAAAGTKWNFLPFKPGLVGGHCIGVDPFYLAQKAQDVGHYSDLIFAARNVNDSMAAFVASQIIKEMIKRDLPIKDAEVLMLGITFKENCADLRNTKVVDVITALKEYGMKVTIYDPWANVDQVKKKYGLECLNQLPSSDSHLPSSIFPQPSTLNSHQPSTVNPFDVIVLGVAHQEFLELNLKPYQKQNAVVYDVKGILPYADAKL